MKIVRKYLTKDKQPPGVLRKFPEKSGQAAFTVLNYNASGVQRQQIDVSELSRSIVQPGKMTWIHCASVLNHECLQMTGETFGIHSLVLEDIQNTDHRVKFEDYPDYNFMVIKSLQMNGGILQSSHIAIIYDSEKVLTFADGNPFSDIEDRILKGIGNVRKKGPQYLLFCLLDSLGDDYFKMLDILENKQEEFSEELDIGRRLTEPADVLRLKNQIIQFRRYIRPLRDVVSGIMNSQSPAVGQQDLLYFRDFKDHALQLYDLLEILVANVDSLISLALNLASHQMNRVMKVLTVISTIFIPLTFIVGIYGMNFSNMPELALPWAYPAVLGILAVLGIIMVIIFKRKKWF